AASCATTEWTLALSGVQDNGRGRAIRRTCKAGITGGPSLGSATGSRRGGADARRAGMRVSGYGSRGVLVRRPGQGGSARRDRDAERHRVCAPGLPDTDDMDARYFPGLEADFPSGLGFHMIAEGLDHPADWDADAEGLAGRGRARHPHPGIGYEPARG